MEQLESLLQGYVDSKGQMKIDLALLRTLLRNISEDRLLDLLKKPEAYDKNLWSPLQLAARKGDIALLECFMENRSCALLCLLDLEDQNILHIAAQANQTNILDYTLHKLREEKKRMDLLTGLSHKIFYTSWDDPIRKFFCDLELAYDESQKIHRANLNPLGDAILNRKFDAIKVILNNVSPEECSVIMKQQLTDFGTVLHLAAAQPNMLEVISLLLQKVPQKDFMEHVTQQDTDGDTPLMISAYAGRIDYAQFFLKIIPSYQEKLKVLDVQNKQMETAEKIAAKEGHKELEKYLSEVKEEPIDLPPTIVKQEASLRAGEDKLIKVKQDIQKAEAKTKNQLSRVKEERASNQQKIYFIREEDENVKRNYDQLWNEHKETTNKLEQKNQQIQKNEESRTSSTNSDYLEEYYQLRTEQDDLKRKMEVEEKELEELQKKKARCERELKELSKKADFMAQKQKRLEKKLEEYRDSIDEVEIKLVKTRQKIRRCEERITNIRDTHYKQSSSQQSSEKNSDVEDQADFDLKYLFIIPVVLVSVALAVMPVLRAVAVGAAGLVGVIALSQFTSPPPLSPDVQGLPTTHGVQPEDAEEEIENNKLIKVIDEWVDTTTKNLLADDETATTSDSMLIDDTDPWIDTTGYELLQEDKKATTRVLSDETAQMGIADLSKIIKPETASSIEKEEVNNTTC
ncbi:cytadherence high molecular weight protein 2-like [Watersipora subatra]|uniref:cytadherence high molecular weight protein 2-like n=1 Tax=Watersipora subatra TaxID=2589382 RepID=UPI00355BD734